MLEQGNYRGPIVEWGFGESSKKGTPYFFIIVAIKERESDEGLFVEAAPTHQRRRVVTMYLSGGAMSISASNIRSLGYNEPNLDRLHPESKNPFNLKGQQVVVNVSYEEYEGKEREKVQLVRQSRRLNLEQFGGLSDVSKAFAEAQQKAKDKEEGKIEDPYAGSDHNEG